MPPKKRIPSPQGPVAKIPACRDRMWLRRIIEGVEREARKSGYSGKQFWTLAQESCPLESSDPLRGMWMDELNTASLRYALFCADGSKAQICALICTDGLGEVLRAAQEVPVKPVVTQTCMICLQNPCRCKEAFTRWYRGHGPDDVFRDEYED